MTATRATARRARSARTAAAPSRTAASASQSPITAVIAPESTTPRAPVTTATSDQRLPAGRPSPSATPAAPTTSAAPESAAKSWIPTKDGSRCPGRLPSNSETSPRNWSRPHAVAATLQATSMRRSGTASRVDRTTRIAAGSSAAYHANFATLTACGASA